MANHDTHDHTGVTGVPSATAPNPTTIELGHASDTTLSRVSAGVVAIEGTNIVKAGAATASGLTVGTDKLLGRDTAGTGAIEEITIGSGLSLNGSGTLSASGSGATEGGVGLYKGTNHALSTSGEGLIILDTEEHDTNTYHFTSDAALTGTVAKAASSATITGSGTSFTTELSVGQVITIPGTAIEVCAVSAITNNTSLTCTANMANTASGQTATRRSGYVVVPSGKAGKYTLTMNGRFSANTRPYLIVRKNTGVMLSGTILLFSLGIWDSTSSIGTIAGGATTLTLAVNDILEFAGISQSGGACNLLTTGPLVWFSADLIGA